MKKLIVILAIVLLPTVAFGWDERYSQEQEMMDSQRNYELRRIANELQYQQEYREYQEKKADYDQYNESIFGGDGSAMGPVFQAPIPPKR
jgi:hypothetical protein